MIKKRWLILYCLNFFQGVDKKEVRRSVIKKATVSAESDIVKELLLMFQSAEDKMLILKRIEDLVHQVI